MISTINNVSYFRKNYDEVLTKDIDVRKVLAGTVLIDIGELPEFFYVVIRGKFSGEKLEESNTRSMATAEEPTIDKSKQREMKPSKSKNFKGRGV